MSESMHDDLGRLMQGMTIGVVRDHMRRTQSQRDLGLGEINEQFQIPVTGSAGTQIAWTTHSISFDYPFYNAPGLRDSDLEYPHMTFGAHLELGQVALVAHVSAWDVDPDDDSIRGATVAIGVHSPGAAAAVDFSGAIHVTFQGYSALHEDETEMQ